METIDEIIQDGDGNAFSIMSRVKKAIKQAGATTEDFKEYQQKAMSGSYENLIAESTDILEKWGYE